MARQLNVLLLVVDSLRARSLGHRRTPCLDALRGSWTTFDRAYAAECWTLPAHLSMFTGLLPSDHRAHFQTMAYRGAQPTLAEVAAEQGYETLVMTRNSLFDGTVPGALRGFQRRRAVFRDASGVDGLFGLVLALAKPRVRRLIRNSGFFHGDQKSNRAFLTTLVRMGMPADRELLTQCLEELASLRRRGRRSFVFVNLYDVHAPYAPRLESPLKPFRTAADWRENLALAWVLPRIGNHSYLKAGFRMSSYGRQMLRSRYHHAVELMDSKLATFLEGARALGILDDTLVVIVSDHGEAFGEHGLYLHDASVYEENLHVPLWVHHPNVPSRTVDRVVSTRQLYGLLRRVLVGDSVGGSILDPNALDEDGTALAEHFHYPFAKRPAPRYRHDLAAVVFRNRKAIVRGGKLTSVDLDRDPLEVDEEEVSMDGFLTSMRRSGASTRAVGTAREHLGRWTS